jgi:hypothetical protein
MGFFGRLGQIISLETIDSGHKNWKKKDEFIAAAIRGDNDTALDLLLDSPMQKDYEKHEKQMEEDQAEHTIVDYLFKGNSNDKEAAYFDRELDEAKAYKEESTLVGD